MLFHRHVSIIPDHIDAPLFNLPGRKIPVAGTAEITLIPLLGIDEKDPVTEFNLFPFQGNHPFEEHHPVSGQTHGDDMKPFGLGKKITQFPAEIDPPIVIGGLHAGPLNNEGGADVPEKEIGRKGDETDSNQEPGGERRKKELADLLIHLYIIKSEPLI